ncbi:biotin synthase BioB [bacterium]|nr:biotin synthase BioB [bacterium]
MVVNHKPENQVLDRQAALEQFLKGATQEIIENKYPINKEEAKRIAFTKNEDLLLLFHYATKIRRCYRGDRVTSCSIVNAKSGRCSENCAFCSQSAHFQTHIPEYPLMGKEEIRQAAHQAKVDGAREFGVVISGKGIRNQGELEQIGEIIRDIQNDIGIEVHPSVGVLSKEQAAYLARCGAKMIHHNLETAERFFPYICSTHSFAERLDTLKNLKNAGVKICSGGIFGMGESWEDRIDMALHLREVDVDTIPMNFLHPVSGTPLGERQPMPPMEILKTIALYRFLLPDKEIKICGGRVSNLRDLQGMIFFAGASSLMVGNYLTTAGREPAQDWQMLKDLGMEVIRE